MNVRHPNLQSFYVRVEFDPEEGFKFDPHYLEVPRDIIATITWFTDDPDIKFKEFVWCEENDHCARHPIVRGRYMVGVAQTRGAVGDVYWKYQIKADITTNGRTHHRESKPCTMMMNGLPAIHPK